MRPRIVGRSDRPPLPLPPLHVAGEKKIGDGVRPGGVRREGREKLGPVDDLLMSFANLLKDNSLRRPVRFRAVDFDHDSC